MKIYTKTGDKGFTTLYGGTKVKKSSPRVNAYGSVDEANSFIGLAAVYMPSPALAELLRVCQKRLFVLAAELASDDRGRRKLTEKITAEDAQLLEKAIDAFSEKLPPHHEFIVPGQSVASAHLHVARTQVRKAERAIVSVSDTVHINPDIIVFMNRLSDLLFVMSRVVDEYSIFHDESANSETKE